MTDSHDIMTR